MMRSEIYEEGIGSSDEKKPLKLITPKWDDTPKFWPAIEGWIAAALEHGGVMLWPQDIYNALIARTMKLWLAFDGATLKGCMVTQLANYPRIKVLSIVAAGGRDAREWMQFDSTISEYARILDCEAIEFLGRQGWEKMVAPYGYKPVVTVFRKTL